MTESLTDALRKSWQEQDALQETIGAQARVIALLIHGANRGELEVLDLRDSEGVERALMRAEFLESLEGRANWQIRMLPDGDGGTIIEIKEVG